MTDCYPPPLVGGRDLLVQMLSQELSRRGNQVEVVSLAGPKGSRTEFDGTIPVHRLAGWSRFLERLYVDPEKPFHPTVPDPGLIGPLKRVLRDLRPEVVHVHSWMLYSLLPILPTATSRLVVSIHEYGFVCPKTTFIFRGGVCSGPAYAKCLGCAKEQYGWPRSVALTTGLRVMRPWSTKVDRYVAVSKATADASSSLIPAGAMGIAVIPPFVPDEAFDRHSSRPDFVPTSGDYLMFAGGLGRHKGIHVLLDAWSSLKPGLPLVLAGVARPDTPKTFPTGVVLAEDVPHLDVLRAWRHCLAAIVPSTWPEPFGMVALEAMAAGRPVIASAVGGLGELVEDGVTGMLVPPGSPRALQFAMERMIGDEPLRRRLGEAGRAKASDYSADSVLGRWEELFAEVTGSAKTSGEPVT